MSNKTYKVGIFIFEHDSYLDINGNIRGVLPEIWSNIKKELSDKYSFEEKIIRSKKIKFYNFQKEVNNEFDILVASYWILPEREKISDFTDTILYNSPVIIYDKYIENKLYIYGFIKKMFKVWFYPILFIITLIFTISMINYVIKYSNNFYDSNLITINLFLSTKNIFLKSNYTKFNNYITFMLTLVFFIMLIIISYTVRETSDMKSTYRLINHSIKGMGIYVRKGDKFLIEMVKKKDGIPIEVEEPIISYNLNKYKKNINGFVFDNLDINSVILFGEDTFGISSVISQWFPVGFPINKKNSELKKDINKVITKLKMSGKIYNNCQYIYNKTIIC